MNVDFLLLQKLHRMFHLGFVKVWGPLGEEFFKKKWKTFRDYLVQ